MGFPSRDGAPSLPPLSPFSSFIFFPTCFWRQWSAFLGAWCPLPAFRSLFCGICSSLKCSFDEFVREKVVSLSYSPTILGPPPPTCKFLQRWNLISVEMFFWWICEGKSGIPVLFLHHLRTTPPDLQFLIVHWNQSVVPCPVLTVSSWPAYRFLKRQVRRSGIPISFRIFHSFLWSTQSKSLA